MRKVLLAIGGSSPGEESAKYALGLARRIKARLEVLRVIRPSVEKVIKGVGRGGRGLEAAMAAAAFAEAGEQDAARDVHRFLSEASRSMKTRPGDRDVDYEVVLKVGDPEQEVARFVKNDREVVLAVLDLDDSRNGGVSPENLSRKLSVPTVTVGKREKRGKDMVNFSLRKKSGVAKLGEKMEQYQQAVTYAEANLPEEATRTLEAAAAEPCRILVLGRDHTFSRQLKDYAVGLANRLGYEIVAVNSKYIPVDFSGAATQFREKLREDFTESSSVSADDFRAQCEDAGVSFRHEIKFGDSTDVLRELHKDYRKLDYVVTEPDESIERPAGALTAIPVFSLAIS
ncbi:MAG: universal stress protein [Pseudomonadota bacterium]